MGAQQRRALSKEYYKVFSERGGRGNRNRENILYGRFSTNWGGQNDSFELDPDERWFRSQETQEIIVGYPDPNRDSHWPFEYWKGNQWRAVCYARGHCGIRN